ncbi:hypothetical protein BC829DRAFT_448395 [Chytridium lagenaria]|nr:hypothetical protein BC829DRAFT_448395 [Chytridium lagenaria]
MKAAGVKSKTLRCPFCTIQPHSTGSSTTALVRHLQSAHRLYYVAKTYHCERPFCGSTIQNATPDQVALHVLSHKRPYKARTVIALPTGVDVLEGRDAFRADPSPRNGGLPFQNVIDLRHDVNEQHDDNERIGIDVGEYLEREVDEEDDGDDGEEGRATENDSVADDDGNDDDNNVGEYSESELDEEDDGDDGEEGRATENDSVADDDGNDDDNDVEGDEGSNETENDSVTNDDGNNDDNGSDNEEFDQADDDMDIAVDESMDVKTVWDSIKSNQEIQNLVTLYIMVTESKLTHKAYHAMINLPYFKETALKLPPKRLQNLIAKINRLPDAVNSNVTAQQHCVPYLPISTVVRFWLSSPVLRQEIVNVNNTSTLPYLTTDQTLRDRIYEMEQNEGSVIHHVWDGCDWLGLLERTSSLWRVSFDRGIRKGFRPLFLHLYFYNDEFGWKGLGKQDLKHLVFMVTAGEMGREFRGRPKSLAVLPIMLCKSKSRDFAGSDALLELFTPDLQELSTGKLFEIEGIKYLVFAYVWIIVGDIPARKEICGLSPSVHAQQPCHLCTMNLGDPIDMPQQLRNNRDMTDNLTINRGNTGLPFRDRESELAARGINRISEILKWPGCSIPVNIVTDLMHEAYLGDCGRFFFSVMDSLPGGADGKWKLLGKESQSYRVLNGTSGSYSFKNASQWRGLKAHGIKLFVKLLRS